MTHDPLCSYTLDEIPDADLCWVCQRLAKARAEERAGSADRGQWFVEPFLPDLTAEARAVIALTLAVIREGRPSPDSIASLRSS